MSRIAVYTGTFDPLTLGHLDIIRRALQLVDRLVIGLPTQSSKSPLFTPAERLDIVRREVAGLPGDIEVLPFDGLAVSFASSVGAQIIVRGLRSGADFDYEDQMAAMNATMAPDIETIFLVASPHLRSISSSLVKEVARGHGEVEHFVPPVVAAEIRARLR